MNTEQNNRLGYFITGLLVGAIVCFICFWTWAVLFASTSNPTVATNTVVPSYTWVPTDVPTLMNTPTFVPSPLPTMTASITPFPVLPNPVVPPVLNHPAGTSGRCNDGEYTRADNNQGACSHHGGLAEWWGK
jgi:hypothetical protein